MISIVSIVVTINFGFLFGILLGLPMVVVQSKEHSYLYEGVERVNLSLFIVNFLLVVLFALMYKLTVISFSLVSFVLSVVLARSVIIYIFELALKKRIKVYGEVFLSEYTIKDYHDA